MSSTPSAVIVVCPDSFKGSADAAGAAAAMAAGARSIFGPDATIIEIPLADGGEGSLDALLASWERSALMVPVHDAIGRKATARYGISADGQAGMIEAAGVNRLPQVSDVPLQPLRVDSRGVGEIARHVLDDGVCEIMLCIGGSASTDGGTGFLSALGARFLDSAGSPVPPGGAGLSLITKIDREQLHPAAIATSWQIAVDVNNPLCGPRGVANVFGQQKGANERDIAVLDAGLVHLAQVLAELTDKDTSELLDSPGAGAAGGLPLALVALLGARTMPGSQMISDALDLPRILSLAEVVLTGEGRFDMQSLGGKVVDAVRRLTLSTTPVVVIAGAIELDSARCRAEGLSAAFSLARGPATLEDLTRDAAELIEDAAAQACSLIETASTTIRTFGLSRTNDPC